MPNKDNSEDFRKWVCKKGNENIIPKCNDVELHKSDCQIPLNILIKAVFTINRDDKRYEVLLDGVGVNIYDGQEAEDNYFSYDDHNNSELQALEEALKFVKKEMRE